MITKHPLIVLLLLCLSLSGFAQQPVPQQKMQEVYEKVKTPYKYGLVIAPTTNKYKVDCPTVFREGNRWYMSYLMYNGQSGKDGRGYETWLAESDDLLKWKTLGKILSFRYGTWDTNQRGGFLALQDNTWGGSYKLNKFKNKYWMTYIGGASTGYESGPLKVGVAFTKNNLTRAHEWESLDKPVMSPEDKDAQWFENITQYKSCVYWDKDKILGKPFVMYYNAGGRHPDTNIKAERIGIALSDDMIHWKRYKGNPVFTHEEGITADAHIQKMGDVYVMFYFSAFRSSRKYKAFNTFACSYDLVHWTDWNGDDLVIPSKGYDNLFAHKSCVIEYNGVVYHFYCGVNKDDQRGIALAVSKPMGRSEVRFPAPEVKGKRIIRSLNEGWYTIAAGENSKTYDSFQVDKSWTKVNVPHNWDDYAGYRQLVHGNRHGTAWYKKEFDLPVFDSDKRLFIRFEGVGTYATVYINGKNLGRHLSGRTTFTLDVTDELKPGKNTIAVKAEHPSMISDMPWVCGGCSSEWGFSEGSQPMGIFRPVTLEVTDKVRVEPFGVHIWNDEQAKVVHIETELKNYSSLAETVEFVSKFSNEDGIQVFRLSETVTLQSGETKIIKQVSPEIKDPHLWSTDYPYLYQLASVVKRGGKSTDEVATPFGIRTVSWPVFRKDGDQTFRLNGKPVFINGVCGYEHQFGQSHAFTEEQIASRVKQIKAAGFNAFRDAHQPHNLLYQNYWDEDGILFWPQFSAHIFYDSPEFRENFKTLLRQWIKERRNSPSVIMWGLQNESALPKEFAEECADIIREMDPTARNQRVITTCNGGEGTDWNVIQNWSGTYGGKPDNYDKEISRQLLNGEYGAWRSVDLHTEGDFDQNGVWSEDRMCQLLEKKIRLAESVKDSCCGQFQWVFSSHDNPGRKQPDEGYRAIDKVGPFNYKGLVTPWEEPLDVYYMYRANYVSAKKDPMVYIVSHTWADRFATGRRRVTVDAYSNCDSVLLYNDATNSAFMGRKSNHGVGTHFMWEHRDVRYNVLRAVGYYEGKPVAEDVVVLNGLEQAPHFEALYKDVQPVLKAERNYNYIYRVNCGGDAYTDEYGQVWSADVAKGKSNGWGSTSWADDYPGLNPYLASQRVTNDPIQGTKDWSLFGHFRFGRHKLAYHFPLPDGEYRIELYFTEPWHGTGGSKDCEGLRVFDVAVNDSVYIKDLDIWAETGHDVAYKKVVNATIKGGELKISFPEVKAGQAVISAIAIASRNNDIRPAAPAPSNGWSWDKVERVVATPVASLPEGKESRATVVYQAEDALVKGKFEQKLNRKQTGICFSKGNSNSIEWNISTGIANVYALRFSYMNITSLPMKVHIQLIAADGTILKNDDITFPVAAEKWKVLSTTTGSFINAGHYKVRISAGNMDGLWFDALNVQ